MRGRDRHLSGRVIFTDISSAPGDSGAPVFDFAGRVVGMVVAGSGEGVSFLQSAEGIDRVLRSASVLDEPSGDPTPEDPAGSTT